MSTPVPLDAAFEHWQAVTDAYAYQITQLERHVPGAAGELAKLGAELSQCLHEFDDPSMKKMGSGVADSNGCTPQD